MPKAKKNMSDIVIEQDAHIRSPEGMTKKILMFLLITWSVFQLWTASPLPFVLGYNLGTYLTEAADFLRESLGVAGVYIAKPLEQIARILGPIDDTQIRSIHLAFAILLAFLVYPTRQKSPRNYIPILDIIVALAGAYCAAYLYIEYDALADRPGLPIPYDIYVAIVGMIILFEATRRSLGPPLMIVAMVFLGYTFFGSADWMPEVVSHKGQSLNKIASHQWLTTEGVFGIAVGVSASFVFLFVLFGALLERAGAGNYFIKVAFAMLGHLRGGPAKAAVLSSGLTGLISGSSIANVVTTGTFTIPLMKRVGFSSEKAAAVEVASSVNGQIMPPVMGAAAFLMSEYVGISYMAVIKHAFLPALISYIALLYIVHLEAVKADMPTLPKLVNHKWFRTIFVWGINISSLCIIAGVAYYGITFLKGHFGETSSYIIGAMLVVVYIGLLLYQSRFPDLEQDDPDAKIVELPELGATLKTGLHFLLPIVVLVWCLMKERLSPGLSAFWATILMIIIILTQKPILAMLRKEGGLFDQFKKGVVDLKHGLADGAKNMIGIGVATAAAGIIVGTISLTGVGQIITEVIELISGGSIILVLLFTGVICLVLGMGLPTTANYIVVSSLMAKVILDLGAQNGLILPPIAIHLFVFYFGIMADVTPPVGLASFAGAAVAGGDPIKTGFQAFFYSMRTIILPFIFLFNTELIMIGVDSFLHGLSVFVVSLVAILVFASATQNFFITKSKLSESVLLLLVSFTLFRPGYWMDMIYPPYAEKPAYEIEKIVGEMPTDSSDDSKNAKVRMSVYGENQAGEIERFVVVLPVVDGETGAERLKNVGLILRISENRPIVDDLIFESVADKSALDYDYVISKLEIPQKQPNKKIFFIPAFMLLAIIALLQKRRKGSSRKSKK